MKKYAKVINEETKQCEVGLGTNSAFYQSIGMTEMEVEQAWNGAWYVKGYAPAESFSSKLENYINSFPEPKDINQIKSEYVRNIRNEYLSKYIDNIVSNPFRWNELDKSTQNQYINYRQYLLNIPQNYNFPDVEVMDLQTWKKYN